MTINEWQKKIYDIAKSKGWYDENVKQSTEVERHMLMVTEISEATEERRKKKPPIYYENGKPEGEQIELADAVIRIMDYFESQGWNLEEAIKIKSDFNETRPYRHGGKLI